LDQSEQQWAKCERCCDFSGLRYPRPMSGPAAVKVDPPNSGSELPTSAELDPG
jgi:hypothetical protein